MTIEVSDAGSVTASALFGVGLGYRLYRVRASFQGGSQLRDISGCCRNRTYSARQVCILLPNSGPDQYVGLGDHVDCVFDSAGYRLRHCGTRRTTSCLNLNLPALDRLEIL
jgi:hypothetical protein